MGFLTIKELKNYREVNYQHLSYLIHILIEKDKNI